MGNANTDLMVDLETLGTKPGSVIVSIGAVFFNREGLGATFYRAVNIEGQIGMTMDAPTVQWWLCQSDEARRVFYDAERVSMNLALADFASWILEASGAYGVGGTRVWGNGSDFDNVLLAEAYRRQGIHQPWKFYNNRCYRTLKSMAREIKPERAGIHHHALDDAVTQANHAINLLNHLNAWG